MCELFGLSADTTVDAAPYLKTLMAHSTDHPHGWGIATFYGNAVSLEKEPKTAWVSDYLADRLQDSIEARSLIAHIRKATQGGMKYVNCHPFVQRDCSYRAWTMAHNGTIFESALLDQYRATQHGSTDSERILCHIIRKINEEIEKNPLGLSREQRFAIIDQVVLEIVEHNKVNLLIYDGDLLYVHTNMAHTLYQKQIPEGIVFATVPLDEGNWEPVPFMQLLAYENGKLICTGTAHSHEYREHAFVMDELDWTGL